MSIVMAYFLKDLRILINYKLQFFSKLFSPIITVLFFFFMTEYFQYTIGNNEIKSKNFYGYIYLGIIFTDISFVIISALPNLIIAYRQQGILEETVTNNKDDFLMLIGNFLMPIFISLIKLMIYFIMGILFFKINIFINLSLIDLAIVLFLSFLSLIGVSLIISSYCLIFLGGNPLQTIFLSISSILGGAFFPPDLLPTMIQPISMFLPIFHILENIRSFQDGSILYNSNIIFLLFISLIYFIIGCFLIRKAIRKAKKDGLLLYF